MSDENKARLAHDVLDGLFAGRILSRENEQLLRSFLPELPTQMTLEALRQDVHDVWAGVNGNEWPDDMYCDLETWLSELHQQLEGLNREVAPAAPAHPEFLKTEADYQKAPEGTIVAWSGRFPWVKGAASEWACSGSTNNNFAMSKIGRRNVLRWGWGK